MAQARHKRDTDARRFGWKPFTKPKVSLRFKPARSALVAAPVALVATAAAVTVGVAAADHGSSDVVAAASPTTPAAQPVPRAAIRIADRDTGVSRSLSRKAAVKARTGEPAWTTAPLDLWKKPGKGAQKDGEAKEGVKVLATGRELDGRVEIVVNGEARWVTKGYLADEKPVAAAAGISMEPCADMSVEDGLKPQTVKVYRSVCHAFPQVTEYGGWAPRTEHNTGNALDVMVYGDKALGDEIAAWAQAHAAELDLYDLIWYDRIWTPVRSAEGWRDYGDHGSATANHMDHVHIGTN